MANNYLYGNMPLPKDLDNGNYGQAVDLNYKLASSDGTVKLWDASVPYKFRVIDMYVVMHGAGAAGDKVKITDGTTDISNDIDVSAASDKDILRASSLDDASWEIAKDGTLAIVSTSGALAEVFIKIVPLRS